MRKVKKKNILDKIDDAINDKIDEIKEKNQEKKDSKPKIPKKKDKKKKIYDYEDETNNEISLKSNNDKKIEFSLDNDENDDVKDNYQDDEANTKKEEKDNTDELEDSQLTDDENTNDFIKSINKKEKKKFDNNKDNEDIDINVKDEEPELKNKKEKKLFFMNKKKKEEKENNESKSKKKLFFMSKKKKESKIIEIEDEGIEEDDIIKKKKKKKNAINKLDSKRNNKPKKEKKKKRAFWKKIVTFILILGIIGVLSVAAFLGYIVATAPEFSDEALAVKDQTVIYDINGNIIATLGTQKRESVTYDALPQVLIDAIIATEDSRFFQHNGVDLFRFIKATIQQLLGHDDAGGASTLTMQTVKNNLTKKDSTESNANLKAKIKKVIRKFQDVYLAVFKVEKEYSKEEILEIYVNDNGLGSSYYGVEEASKYYFGKSVSDITLPEAALIAGLFQAPNRHNPYKDIDSATKRRSIVLQLMERHGYITKEEREIADSIPISSLLVGANTDKTPYQGYVDTVVKEVEKLTDHGDGTGGDDPYTVPMKIYTTMERGIQDGINSVLNNNGASYWKDAGATAGIAVVNVNTGAIAAVGGGRNKDGEKLFNNATQAHRQPGSTAKPLFDYGPGIEYNNFSSYQLFNDEPWTYTNGPTVNNWDGGHAGLITMRYALQVSRNVPALKAFQQVGPKNVQKFVSSLGLDVSLNSSSDNYHVFSNGLDNTINEAYSIGGAAEGYTPLEMAAAYSGFASGGYYTEPYTVTKIIYRETGEEKEYKHSKERVMKDSTAYIMNNILESAVVSGFNGGARVGGSHVAAKTGTSNFDSATMKSKGLPSYAVNDLWTVAYTSQYSIGVWYGYEKLSDGYNTNGGYKDSLTTAVMQYIPKDTKGWSMPSSVVAVTVEKETWPAKLPSEYTPSDMRITEYFVRGTQPTEVSERYQKFSPITSYELTDKKSNSVTITWNYKTPNVLTDEYLRSYFSNSVYGNQKQTYLNRRKEYNEKTLGGFGFGVYQKQEDGSLKLIDFTTENKYTYTGYGNATIVIKAEYKSYKSNASDGLEIKVSLDNLSNDNLKVVLNGEDTERYSINNYTDQGIKSIKYNNLDITTNANVTVKYQINVENTIKEFTTTKELEEYINTLPAGTYTVTYNIAYLSIETAKKRTIILK